MAHTRICTPGTSQGLFSDKMAMIVAITVSFQANLHIAIPPSQEEVFLLWGGGGYSYVEAIFRYDMKAGCGKFLGRRQTVVASFYALLPPSPSIFVIKLPLLYNLFNLFYFS